MIANENGVSDEAKKCVMDNSRGDTDSRRDDDISAR